MTTQVWRRAAMISQDLLRNITGLGVGCSFPCSHTRFTATEASWVLSCPYLSSSHSWKCPVLEGLNHSRWQLLCPGRYKQPPFCVLLLGPHFPVILHFHCRLQQCLVPSPTPCLVCLMSFVACGCGTGLIGEPSGCSQHVAISCLVLQLPRMAPLPEMQEAQFGLAFRDRAV